MSSKNEEEQTPFLNKNDLMEIQKKEILTIPLNKVNTEKRDNIPTHWKAEYIKTKINDIKDIKHRTLFKFLWYTGTRITEALNTTKKDLNLEEHTIKINWLKNRKYKYRIIPLHPRLKDILEIYASTKNAEDRLFPYTRQYAQQLSQKYLGGNPHKIRHSFGMYWRKNRGDLEKLSKMLGHSSIESTKIYSTGNPHDIGEELHRLDF